MNIVNEFFNNKSSTKDLATEFFEARSASMSSREDHTSPIKPVCTNPETGFSKSFDTIQQAAEWLVNNDNEDEVPKGFGKVRKSKYGSLSWENLPKQSQNSIMNNILNAACKKETRGDLDPHYRASGYGFVWELDDPSEIVDDDIRCSYDEGHGIQEDRETLKAKYAVEKEEKAKEKAKQLKQDMINYVNKRKDWAIYKLKKTVNTRTNKSLFDEYECEETYGYPKLGMEDYWSNFSTDIKLLQVRINTKVAPGKKAKNIIKYFEYLEKVAEDVGLNVDKNGFLVD